jgi:hypothetical protein
MAVHPFTLIEELRKKRKILSCVGIKVFNYNKKATYKTLQVADF